MDKYIEPAKEIPIVSKVDVVVIGGGPAGFSAAVNAARGGAKTMLIEQSGTVGGVATSGLMSHWTGGTQGGFYEEIIERSKDTEETDIKHLLDHTINPEKLKFVFLEMLDEAGVDLKLYTFACAPIMESNKTTGVVIESKSGREAVMAKVVIDASGDGDIAAKAGVPFTKGREDDGKMQPMTLMFKVGGVDTKRAVFLDSFEDTCQVPEGDLQTLGKKTLPFPAGHILLYRTTLPGIVTCNMTNCIEVDGTKAGDLTKAEYECRKQMNPIVDFLRRYVPGYEKCFVISSASIIGVRETRHLEGEYTLTEKDILCARIFEDWVVTKAYFNFDVHNISGSGLDKSGAQKEFAQAKGYTIPYRCFIPRKIENLMFCGRNISGNHLAHSNYRVMPICANMGQAIGNAAALCIYKNVTPRELNASDLQKKLKSQGVEV